MRLVLCDDHDMLLDAMTTALTRRGHEVLATVTDPDAVGDAVRQHRPEVCVVDLTYTRVFRPDVVDLVRAADAEVAVAFLTGRSHPAVWAALDAGHVQAVIGKRCDLDGIDRGIRAAAARERAVIGLHRPAELRQESSMLAQMTRRERDVLRLLVRGASTQEMVNALGISANTVRTHIQHVLDKLGAHNRVQAATRALQLQIIEADPTEA